MRPRRRDWLAVLAVGFAATTWGSAWGQAAPGPSGRGAPGPALSPLIASNPAFNPYMASAGGIGRVDDATGTLLMMSVVSSQTGLGSGRLSGARGGGDAGQRAAEMPHGLSRPGGTAAARYFERGPGVAAGAGRYYNRHNRHFMNNGR